MDSEKRLGIWIRKDVIENVTEGCHWGRSGIGEPLYKHVPFYIRVNEENLHALGLFYNNSYDAVFDMGNERSGYWDSYCYYQADGGDIDLFLINGPKMASVLERYTYLTGRAGNADEAVSRIHSFYDVLRRVGTEL